MLEVLVHLKPRDEDLPRTFKLMEIASPEELAVKNLLLLASVDWKEDQELTRRIGDEWLASGETALARVPSAILPRTWNVLLNPAHGEASKIEIVEVIRERFDNRLFRFGER